MTSSTQNTKGFPERHLTPYQVGWRDGKSGELCLPELFFLDHRRQKEYAEGHLSSAGHTLLGDQIIERTEMVQRRRRG